MDDADSLALAPLGSLDDCLLALQQVAGREPTLVLHTPQRDDRPMIDVAAGGALELRNARALPELLTS